MRRLGMVLISGWLLIGCQLNLLDSPSRAQTSSFTGCRDLLSRSETINRITGRWRLAGTGCGDCLQQGPVKPTETITLVINRDQSIQVYKDNQLVRSTTFSLSDTYNAGYFRFQFPDKLYVSYVNGIIETCPGRLVFNDGYVDGPIYYYESM